MPPVALRLPTRPPCGMLTRLRYVLRVAHLPTRKIAQPTPEPYLMAWFRTLSLDRRLNPT